MDARRFFYAVTRKIFLNRRCFLREISVELVENLNCVQGRPQFTQCFHSVFCNFLFLTFQLNDFQQIMASYSGFPPVDFSSPIFNDTDDIPKRYVSMEIDEHEPKFNICDRGLTALHFQRFTSPAASPSNSRTPANIFPDLNFRSSIQTTSATSFQRISTSAFATHQPKSITCKLMSTRHSTQTARAVHIYGFIAYGATRLALVRNEEQANDVVVSDSTGETVVHCRPHTAARNASNSENA